MSVSCISGDPAFSIFRYCPREIISPLDTMRSLSVALPELVPVPKLQSAGTPAEPVVPLTSALTKAAFFIDELSLANALN